MYRGNSQKAAQPVAEWHSALPSKPEVVGSNPAETGRIFRVCKNPVSVALSEGSLNSGPV